MLKSKYKLRYDFRYRLILLFIFILLIAASIVHADNGQPPPFPFFDYNITNNSTNNSQNNSNNSGNNSTNPSQFLIQNQPNLPVSYTYGFITPTVFNSTLQIIQLDAKVDDERDKNLENNDKIRSKAKEESNIEFEFEIKNKFEKEIEDIQIITLIENIDDGDDLKEKSRIFSLAPNDSKEIDLDFELPLKVDDGDYDIEIDIKGKDKDNNLHKLKWQLILEVKKDKITKEVDITIENSNQLKEEKSKIPVKTIKKNSSQTIEKIQQKPKQQTQATNSYSLNLESNDKLLDNELIILLLIISITVVTGLIIFLIKILLMQ